MELLLLVCRQGKGRTSIQIEVNGEKKGELSMSTGEFDYGAEIERKYPLVGLHDVDSIKITTLSGGPARLDYVSIPTINLVLPQT